MRGAPKFRQNMEIVHQALLDAVDEGMTLMQIAVATKLTYREVQEAASLLRNKSRVTFTRHIGNATLTLYPV